MLGNRLFEGCYGGDLVTWISHRDLYFFFDLQGLPTTRLRVAVHTSVANSWFLFPTHPLISTPSTFRFVHLSTFSCLLYTSSVPSALPWCRGSTSFRHGFSPCTTTSRFERSYRETWVQESLVGSFFSHERRNSTWQAARKGRQSSCGPCGAALWLGSHECDFGFVSPAGVHRWMAGFHSAIRTLFSWHPFVLVAPAWCRCFVDCRTHSRSPVLGCQAGRCVPVARPAPKGGH